MGIFSSLPEIPSDPAFPERKYFVQFVQSFIATFGIQKFTVYVFDVRFGKYSIRIYKTFWESKSLERRLTGELPGMMANVFKIPSTCIGLERRDKSWNAKALGRWLQSALDCDSIAASNSMFRFLGISKHSFNSLQGRMGKEGYLQKRSGGYTKRFSNKFGDWVRNWRTRYVVIRDTYIAYYKSPADSQPRGVIQIDSSFMFWVRKKIIYIKNSTRELRLKAHTYRTANEWFTELQRFITNNIPRISVKHLHESSFPPRTKCEAKVFTLSCDYMASVAVAMLRAQSEILITSWKNSPKVLVTRPPLPPIRLDQILKFKADQGVKIYILLYKEVELAGQGNDSFQALSYLESLSPNIRCIRHPNKFIGGSTAILWSHHEKLVIVDNNTAFVGGIDLAFNRWDDGLHQMNDEDGLKYPGKDYRQPGPGKFKPARVLKQQQNLNKNNSVYDDEMDDDVELTFEGNEEGDESISSKRSSKRPDMKGSISDKGSSNGDSQSSSIISGAKSMATNLKNTLVNITEKISGKNKTSIYEVRDIYPRMGWHDVHAGISGTAARDVRAHFVKRWNHHRLSAGYRSSPILTDVTDLTSFGVCARCGLSSIHETIAKCPSCEYDLGEIAYFLNPSKIELLPILPAQHSFLTFECALLFPLNLVFHGECPVFVQSLSLASNLLIGSSSLQESQGVPPESPDKTYSPMAGDIVVKVDGQCVSHLDVHHLNRYIKRRHREKPDSIRITFRRYPVSAAAVPIRVTPKAAVTNALHQNAEASEPLPEYTIANGLSPETLFSISKLIHEEAKNIDLIAMPAREGTCNVQLIRSLGPWSSGSDREQSIMRAWCNVITQAEKFVYIENQFFIGNLCGNDAINVVASAILERIVRAAQKNEKFKAIIIIPQHPNGDLPNSIKPRTILHFEYQTICRSQNSIFEQFRKRVPGVDVSKYIGFYCLRNWGAVNDKFYSDQIYVHDKVLIADDRYMIVGSANINDRSMLGDRDSEVAISVSDENRVTITMDGHPFVVGKLPHETRLKLMRQHVDPAFDLVDILNDEVFNTQWHGVAAKNQQVYDDLDGPSSVYKCQTLDEYTRGLNDSPNRSMQDPMIQSCITKIKGHLVCWPLDFLKNENCAPSIATRALISNDIWV